MMSRVKLVSLCCSEQQHSDAGKEEGGVSLGVEMLAEAEARCVELGLQQEALGASKDAEASEEEHCTENDSEAHSRLGDKGRDGRRQQRRRFVGQRGRAEHLALHGRCVYIALWLCVALLVSCCGRDVLSGVKTCGSAGRRHQRRWQCRRAMEDAEERQRDRERGKRGTEGETEAET